MEIIIKQKWDLAGLRQFKIKNIKEGIEKNIKLLMHSKGDFLKLNKKRTIMNKWEETMESLKIDLEDEKATGKLGVYYLYTFFIW